jgi:hypothetical protein
LLMATVFTPYTEFLVALAGLAVGAAALVAVSGTLREAAPASATAAVAVLLAVLVLPVLWRGGAGLDVVRSGLREPDPNVRHEKCFFDSGHQWQLGFVAWIQARIQPRDSFALDSRDVDPACFQLNMLPRRLVRAADEPLWTVWIRKFSPELRDRIRQERSVPRDERRVRVLEPGLALIRER